MPRWLVLVLFGRRPLKRESNLQRQIMLHASDAGYTVFRNNTGVAWTANERRRQGRDLLLVDARPVHFGLITGSSDLIGIRPVIVTPDMVGQTIGVFVALEVKTKRGRVTREQQHFLDHIAEQGGIAAVVRGVGDIPFVQDIP